MNNRRLIQVVAGFIGVLILIFISQYLLSLRSLTVNYKNVNQVTIFKTADLKNNKDSEPYKTITESGKTVKIPKGSYTLQYTGADGYADGLKTIDLTKSQTVSFDPYYSSQHLSTILDSEFSNITETLSSNYPQVSLYTINRGTLYHTGEWYSTTLVYQGEDFMNADTLRVILHKESGVWVIKTDPPSIMIDQLNHPDIPTDILNATNNF